MEISSSTDDKTPLRAQPAFAAPSFPRREFDRDSSSFSMGDFFYAFDTKERFCDEGGSVALDAISLLQISECRLRTFEEVVGGELIERHPFNFFEDFVLQLTGKFRD